MTDCKTPGATFQIVVGPTFASVQIDHPTPVDLTKQEAIGLEDEMHDAMEAIFARFYKGSP